MNLDDVLCEAEAIERAVYDLFAGRHEASERRVLAFMYFSQAAEHHSAIILLIRSQLYGSSLALCRAVFEIMYRSNWVAHQGTDSDVDSILKGDDFKFPSLGTMGDHLDEGLNGVEQFVALKEAHWKELNSFTHSGALQLMRRHKGESIEPNYPIEELISAVKLVTASMLMSAVVVGSYGDAALQDRLMQIVTAYGADGEPANPKSV